MSAQTEKRNRMNSHSIGAELLVLAIFCLVVSGCAGTTKSQDKLGAFTPPKQIANSSAIPYPEAGPQPSSLTPTGSLWAPSAGSLYSDLRASKIGDLITITVSEESKGSKVATTSTSRAKTSGGQASFSGAGVGPSAASNQNAAFSFGPYSTSFNNNFKGDGKTEKTDSMTAYMTATVVDVLPNGNLLIRGSRWTKVNDEMQQMILEGVVRPTDISRNNSVSSQSVAEAKIFMVGKGPVTQHQKPGWLNQFVDLIFPF
jgi:flagellar L-ring protein precursor FlgH